jgi:hypothetical protein
MNSNRIEAIQNETAYPDSQSVKLALFTVWSETERHSTPQAGGVITALEAQVEQQKKEIHRLKNLVLGRDIDGVLIPGKPLRQL